MAHKATPNMAHKATPNMAHKATPNGASKTDLHFPNYWVGSFDTF